MLVYRDGKRRVDARERARALAATRDPLDRLLRAGELETALSDAGDPRAADLARLADEAAAALIAGRACEITPAPDTGDDALEVGTPEGFAYYALHPLDHAAAALRAVAPGEPVLVIGVRSIGVTLSAAVAAALRARGHEASRVTVRPGGHPFTRALVLDGDTALAVDVAARARARFLVVDEGPGLSGSTFRAVADALRARAVPVHAITLLPSHDPDPASLRAPDGAARWRELTRAVATSTRTPPAGRDVSGGAWRRELGVWPAVWPATERRKILSDDGTTIFKFEGLGMYGEAPLRRAHALADAGLAPIARAGADGFVAHARAPGAPMRPGDPPPLEAIARRIAHAPPAPDVSAAALEDMIEVNLAELLGVSRRVSLPVDRPVIVDGHLAPHEWIHDGARVLKVDGISHGDDHFFPGPCDVAWDLAGAVVEWNLDDGARAALVARHVEQTGDRAIGARLPAWTLAYAAHRAAWLAMAREACRDGPESERLAAEAAGKREILARLVPLTRQ